MITEMVMPQVTITSDEVKIIAWLKKVGDKVVRGDSLLEVETEKAIIEVEAYVDGYLREIRCPDGNVVKVETIIALLSSSPDEALLVPSGITAKTSEARAQSARVVTEENPIPTASNRRLTITPVARKIVLANHLDLRQLVGSGPNGRIIRADVEAAVSVAARLQRPIAEGEKTEVAQSMPGLNAMRSAIAARTTLSKSTIPHFYLSIDVDMTSLLSFRGQVNKAAAELRVALPTITDWLVLTCSRVLPHHQKINAHWTDSGPVTYPEINIGLAVGLDEGLIIPVIHNANTLGLASLSVLTQDLKEKARLGGLSAYEISGGTFTISNLGQYGIDSFIAVINPTESAILAVGAIKKRPVVLDDDSITVRSIMNLTLSVDHRCIDGIAAAKFLAEVKRVLENPVTLLLQ